MSLGSSPLLPPERRSTLGSDGLRRRFLFGLDLVDAAHIDEVIRALLAPTTADHAQSMPLVVTPNVDIVVMLDRHRGSPEALAFGAARIVLPDGMPLVAVSKLVRRPLAARLTGSELFSTLWPRLDDEGMVSVAVCATQAIADLLGEGASRASFVVPPLFDPTDPKAVAEVVDQTLEQVMATGARFVFFGVGHPRDAILGAELCRRWPGSPADAPWCLGVGGAMAMYTGLTKRAPAFVQRVGAEWLYRFVQEPRRLFTRYFVRDLGFIPIVLREIRAARRYRSKEPNRER